MNISARRHPAKETYVDSRGRSFLPLSFLFLNLLLLSGCATTVQHTYIVGEINELRTWDDREVMWVETVQGERLEFVWSRTDTTSSGEVTSELVSGGGRIKGTRNRETRRVDYVIVGRIAEDTAAGEREIPLSDLTVVNTRVKKEDGWGSITVVTVTVAAALVVAAIVSFGT